MATARSGTAQTQNDADWFQSQRQNWDLWLEAQRGHWTALLEEWRKAVSSGEAPPSAGAYQKIFAQAGEQFLGMMQTFWRQAEHGKPASDTARDWAQEAQKNFSALGESMAKAGGAWASALHDGGAAAPFSVPDPFGFWASMPGIGYTREKQEEAAKLYRLWSAFERASQSYNAAMTKVGIAAVMRFQDHILNPPKDAPPLKSLKEIYAKWVDICEEVYAKYAVTKEYTDLYGDTVNALMAWKKQLNTMADDAMGELGLPTRREIDSLHERMHALRRDNLRLRKDLAELKKAPAKKPRTAAKTSTQKKGGRK
jgi:hypothetical protein